MARICVASSSTCAPARRLPPSLNPACVQLRQRERPASIQRGAAGGLRGRQARRRLHGGLPHRLQVLLLIEQALVRWLLDISCMCRDGYLSAAAAVPAPVRIDIDIYISIDSSSSYAYLNACIHASASRAQWPWFIHVQVHFRIHTRGCTYVSVHVCSRGARDRAPACRAQAIPKPQPS